MKVCTKCGVSKHTSEFNKRAVEPDGFQYYCKICQKSKMRSWSKTTKGKACMDRSHNSIRSRFHNHKFSAKRRGIPFLFTFESWWAIWAPH